MAVFRDELPAKRAELTREVASYQLDLEQRQKQLRYLKTLAKQQQRQQRVS